MNVSSIPMGFATRGLRALTPVSSKKVGRIHGTHLMVHEADQVGRKVSAGWSMEADLTAELGTEGSVKMQLFHEDGALQVRNVRYLIDYSTKKVVPYTRGITRVSYDVAHSFYLFEEELRNPSYTLAVPKNGMMAFLNGTDLRFCRDRENFVISNPVEDVKVALDKYLREDARREIVMAPSGRFAAVASEGQILFVQMDGTVYPVRERNTDFRSLWFSEDGKHIHAAEMCFGTWICKEVPAELRA